MKNKTKRSKNITLSSIVAIDNNNAIGKGNQIPWKVPSDLKYFKEKTMGHHIIMGRKTYESIGKPLPGRMTIVVTKDANFVALGSHVAHSMSDAIALCPDNEETFVVGGNQIYQMFWNVLDLMYVTRIDCEVKDADTFYPQFTPEDWLLLRETLQTKGQKDEYAFKFQTFLRRDLIGKNIKAQ